jgi:hypothetical protein
VVSGQSRDQRASPGVRAPLFGAGQPPSRQVGAGELRVPHDDHAASSGSSDQLDGGDRCLGRGSWCCGDHLHPPCLIDLGGSPLGLRQERFVLRAALQDPDADAQGRVAKDASRRTRREGRVAKDALRSASAFSNASSTLPSSLSSSPGRTRRRPCPAGRCRRCSRARTPGALRSLSPAPARSTRRGPARLAFAAHRTSRSSAPSDGARDAAFLNNFLTRRQFCLFLTISCAVVGLSRSNCCVFAVPLAASRSFDQ